MIIYLNKYQLCFCKKIKEKRLCSSTAFYLKLSALSHHLMTTPNSTISEPYKHLTIAKAYIAGQIAPWRSTIFGCGQFRTFRPGFVFGQHYHVDRHGQLTLKQLRLSDLNEMHTNSYSGPRLIKKITVTYFKQFNFID